jgi:hypothetical protein
VRTRKECEVRGTSGQGLISSGQEVTVKVYGVADDDAAGVEPGA